MARDGDGWDLRRRDGLVMRGAPSGPVRVSVHSVKISVSAPQATRVTTHCDDRD